MKGELIVATNSEICGGQAALPTLIESAGNNARFAWDEFFAIENEHTRAAYETAVQRFLGWCEIRGLGLTEMMPGHVSDYERNLKNQRTGRPASKETRKQHLSAIRKFFDLLVIRHAVMLNPAKSVRGAKVTGNQGKTPPVPESVVPGLMASIDGRGVVGSRDRAIFGVLLYTAVRRAAVSKLRLRDFWTDGIQYYLRFDEKGSKQRDIPVRHDLQQWLESYITAAGIDDEGESPLFRAAINRSGRLSDDGLSPPAISKLAKRRFKAVGLPKTLVAHSFRAATITNLLKQGVPLENSQSYCLLLMLVFGLWGP